MHRILDHYGIQHGFEIYPGNHTSGVTARIEQHVLPFFTRHLGFGDGG